MDSKIGRLRQALVRLLAHHDAAGTLPTSGRFLFYELVQAGEVSKTKTGARRPDQDMTEALTQLREAGSIPWAWIVDETRSLDDWLVAESVRDWLQKVLEQARIDPWQGDPPIVLTESRSLAGVLRGLAQEYAVPIAATNGQVGGFLHNVVAPRLHSDQRVLYLGDLDLAGNQIEANTRRVLEHEVGPLRWERLALTRPQAADYGLTPIIKQDRRYADGRPHEAIETEALRQEVIVAILRDRLDTLIPEPLDQFTAQEERERREVSALFE